MVMNWGGQEVGAGPHLQVEVVFLVCHLGKGAVLSEGRREGGSSLVVTHQG